MVPFTPAPNAPSQAEAETRNSIMDAKTGILSGILFFLVPTFIVVSRLAVRDRRYFYHMVPVFSQLVSFAVTVCFPLGHYLRNRHLRSTVLSGMADTWREIVLT